MQLHIGDDSLDLTNKTILMGILNLSLDSPIKKSVVSTDLALERAQKLRKDGAKIIDVGAHSTSSKTEIKTTDEELKLVIPVIKKLIDEGFLVSLDSWNPKVVEDACNQGLHFLNDVNGLQNQKMVDLVKKFDLTTCIMHMRGEPKMHYTVDQTYDSISLDIHKWFEKKIETLESQGISKQKLIVDPGFEFGKSMKDNLILLNDLNSFLDFGIPLLVSASNKAFIAEAIGLGRTQQGEGVLEATIAVQTLSAYFGAHILRVHDVKSNYYAIEFVNKMRKEIVNTKR